MKGGRVVFLYSLALAIGVFLQFDRVEPWLSGKFADALPPMLETFVKDGESLHQACGLTGLGLALDCSTDALFDNTYKNTYRCRARTATASAENADRDEAAQAETGDPAGKAKPVLERVSPPCNVLVVGDSLAVTLSVSLDKALRRFDGLTMIPKGKIASGLENPQYFNWGEALPQFLDEYSPKLVVVMMGANDAKYLNLDPQAPEPTALDDKRRAAYQARLKKFLAVMDERGVRSYWIGLPVMGDPDLSSKSQALNAITRQACLESTHGRFLDTWSLLAGPGGVYAQHIQDSEGHKVRVREGDKIHFSTAGGDIIVKAFLRDAQDVIDLKPRETRQMAEAPSHEEATGQ